MRLFTKSRAYAGAKDLQSMLDLLIAVRPVERITDYPSIVDLQEMLALTSTQGNTRLWFDAEGQPVGFAFVDQYNNLRFELDPQMIHSEIPSEMVNWGVMCIQRAMLNTDRPLMLDASCRDDDHSRVALLEQHGFVKQEMRSLHMARSLDEPIPIPHIPMGFSVRHVAGEQEASAVVDLHRAAFGTRNMTLDERLSIMRTPDYEMELDLLIIAPNGRFAAYCTCSIYQEENAHTGRSEGYTDPVATHPDFQRQGLARALLLTGCRKLKERGVKTAVLGTSSKNIGMRQCAEATGFHVQSTKIWFEKPVSC